MIAKAGPVAAIVLSILAVVGFGLVDKGVKIVGDIPAGLPPFALPSFDLGLWQQLLLPAVLISLVGFVESVSVAQTLAAKRRQRIVPNQELTALGASNIASALSGGYPVTGGFARSVVNFDAGAETPLAGAFTAAGILGRYGVSDPAVPLPAAGRAGGHHHRGGAVAGRYRRDQAHLDLFQGRFRGHGRDNPDRAAGRGRGGDHCRRRLCRSCCFSGAPRDRIWPLSGRCREPSISAMWTATRSSPIRRSCRSGWTKACILPMPARWRMRSTTASRIQPALKNVILMCPAVNAIDASALESLEAIAHRLDSAGIGFHLSEVKGPVMDALMRSDFLQHFKGRIFLTQFEAVTALASAPLAVRSSSVGHLHLPGRLGALGGDDCGLASCFSFLPASIRSSTAAH